MEPTTELPTQKNIEVQLANKDGSNTWWKASVIQDLGDELWVKWDGLEIEGMPQYELIPKTSPIKGGRKKRRTKKNRKKRTKRRRRKKRTRRK